jgi:uncharacterized protein (DUF1697 family)
MKHSLVLLRGVNVGGVVLKMDDLRALLAGLGFKAVRTYIQSGNAIVEGGGGAAAMEKSIATALSEKLGLEVGVIVKGRDELAAIVAEHPFATGDNDKELYVTVLGGRPDEEGKREILGLGSDTEKFAFGEGAVYALYLQGYGHAKFTNNYLEKKLKVRCTTRNWNTMRTLLAMMDE